MLVRTKSENAEKALAFAVSMLPNHLEIVEEQKPEPKPALALWPRFVASVKASDMTDAMKVACVAQAIIESGRGTSRVAKELTNFWGIKYRDVLEGLAVPQRIEVTSETQGWDIFAKFPDADTAVKGWLKFLTRSYYAGWEAHKNSPSDFIRHIGKSWCPAPGYAEKVIRCIGEAEMLLGIEQVEPREPTGKILIGLNAGHAGTTGASGKNKAIQEHIENAVQRDRVKAILEASGRFECVNIDQTQFNGDLLATGKAFAKCRIGVSFHQNAATGVEHGAEVLVGSPATSESKALAAKLSKAMADAQSIKDRGVKDKNVTIISGAREVGCPCFVLTESQFVDDETDPKEARRKTLLGAEAIAKVIKEHSA